jgi:hypothetical protein
MRRAMGRAAPEVRSRFDVNRICARWERVIAGCPLPRGYADGFE